MNDAGCINGWSTGSTTITWQDPNGKNQHESGAKLDAGKIRVGLFFKDFPRALLEVAKVVTYGANKYTPSGWVDVPNGDERYEDALGRHLLEGNITKYDEESELLHLAHRAWNALSTLELYLREQEEINNGK
jgi:hypothetical protein